VLIDSLLFEASSMDRSGTVLIAAIFLGTLAATTLVSGQQPRQAAPPPGETTAPSLKVTTRLVQLNVIVNDKRGNPITGLSKEDFLLFDNKQPQGIQFFSSQTNALPNKPPAPLPPDTYSNRFTEQANVPPSVTVILLDALNTEFADQALTRNQILKFLDQVRPQDRIALYWLGNNLYALHDFTADVASLRREGFLWVERPLGRHPQLHRRLSLHLYAGFLSDEHNLGRKISRHSGKSENARCPGPGSHRLFCPS
jgi:hypothetical protein